MKGVGHRRRGGDLPRRTRTRCRPSTARRNCCGRCRCRAFGTSTFHERVAVTRPGPHRIDRRSRAPPRLRRPHDVPCSARHPRLAPTNREGGATCAPPRCQHIARAQDLPCCGGLLVGSRSRGASGGRWPGCTENRQCLSFQRLDRPAFGTAGVERETYRPVSPDQGDGCFDPDRGESDVPTRKEGVVIAKDYYDDREEIRGGARELDEATENLPGLTRAQRTNLDPRLSPARCRHRCPRTLGSVCRQLPAEIELRRSLSRRQRDAGRPRRTACCRRCRPFNTRRRER